MIALAFTKRMTKTWLLFSLSLLLMYLPQSVQAETPTGEDLAYTTGVTAYIWGYPLVKTAHIRMALTRPDLPPDRPRKTNDFGAPMNRIWHSPTLANPDFQVGVGPNCDTMYSLCWIDLENEPFILLTPDFGERYYTFSIYDSFSGAAASPGMRTHGSRMPPIAIVSQGWHGSLPEGVEPFRVPTRYGEVAGRILVDGQEDVKNVLPLQAQIKLISLSEYLDSEHGKSTIPEQRPLDDPEQDVPIELQFFEQLGQIMKDQPPAPLERGLLGLFKNIGLSVENGFDYASLDDGIIRGLKRAVINGARIVEEKSLNLGYNINGWTINPNGSRFGNDYLLRAGVAKDQIFVTIPEEAIYPIARVDGTGQPLNGVNAYLMHFKAGELPPAKAFWSITAYNDSGVMVHNPIDRYAIGDRTRGLKFEPDGSLKIYIQHEAPDEKKKSNWLPVPRDGFYFMMRLYIPGEAVLTGRWQPPAVLRVGQY